MVVITSVNKIYNFLKKNKEEIFYESDLKCLLFAELMKDKRYNLTTEWRIRKNKAVDILVYKKKNLDIQNKTIDIKKIEKLIELKFTFYGHNLNGVKKDILKLKTLRGSAKELYAIYFDVGKEPISKEKLEMFKEFSSKNGVKFIYRYLNIEIAY